MQAFLHHVGEKLPVRLQDNEIQDQKHALYGRPSILRHRVFKIREKEKQP